MTDSEMRRIVVESLPLANGQYDRSMLSDSSKHKSAFSRGLKSSLNTNEYYNIQKRIDEETGKITMEIVTNARNELNALASVKTTMGNLSATTGAQYGVSGVSAMYPVKGTVSLTGKQAVANARASIMSKPLGSFSAVEGEAGKYTYSYLTSTTDKELVAKERQAILKEARTISNNETKRVINNYNNEVINGGDSASASVNGNNVSGNNVNIGNGNGNGEYRRNHLATLMRLIGMTTLIVGLLRRILTSVTDFAKQSVEDTITAHNLNLSYDQLREFRYLEKAHGLREGALSGGVSEIETSFGNITALDDNKLKALAILVPGISDFIGTGMGKSNPEALMGIIIDAFNKRAKEGVNSVGAYVGEEQARRELYEYLNKIFPNIASVFAVMQEEQSNVNSLYRGMAGTYEEWKRTMSGKAGNMTVTNQGLLYTLGEEANLLTATFAKLKETLAIEFAPALISLLDKINKLKIGMTSEEKLKTGVSARNANRAYKTELESKIKTLEGVDTSNMSVQERLMYDATMETYKDYLKVTEEMLLQPVYKQTSVVPTDNMFDEAVASSVAFSLLNKQRQDEFLSTVNYPVEEVNLSTEQIDIAKGVANGKADAVVKKNYLDKLNEKRKQTFDKGKSIYDEVKKSKGTWDIVREEDLKTALDKAVSDGKLTKEEADLLRAHIKSKLLGGAYFADSGNLKIGDALFQGYYEDYKKTDEYQSEFNDIYTPYLNESIEKTKQLQAHKQAKESAKFYQGLAVEKLLEDTTERNKWTAFAEAQDVINNANVSFSGYNRAYVTTDNVNDNGTIKSEITLHLVGDEGERTSILMSSKEGQTIFRGEGNINLGTKQITEFNASTK